MNPASLPVPQKVQALVKALNGAKRTNEALARCRDGEAMIEVLVDASRKLGLGLSREDLLATPRSATGSGGRTRKPCLPSATMRPATSRTGARGAHLAGRRRVSPSPAVASSDCSERRPVPDDHQLLGPGAATESAQPARSET